MKVAFNYAFPHSLLTGGIGVLYVMVWLWIAQEKPSHHRMITEDELRFIEELQGSDKLDYEVRIMSVFRLNISCWHHKIC